jgi:23S rRNA pseudouridine2605 synthase
MNPQDNDQQPLADTGAVPDTEAAPKPRKRRASTKPAAVDAGVVADAVPTPAETAAEAAPAKPKRTRRKVVPVADEAVAPDVQLALPMETPPVAPAAVTVSEPPAPPAVASASPEPAPAAGSPPRDMPPAPPAVASAPPEPAPAAGSPPRDMPTAPAEVGQPSTVEGAPETGGEAAADAPGEGAPGEDGPRRRNRNRRRGRRSGERASAEQAAGEGAEMPAGDAPRRLPELAAADDDDDDDDDMSSDDGADAVTLPPADAGETFADVLSGAYDALPTEDLDAVPERRVLAAEPDAPKLHKVLAQAGIGSRRDMEQLIADGRVTVNGQPAHTGQRISFGDQIKVGGKPVKVRIVPPLPRVLAYHKPVGEVVTHDDPQHRPTVFRRLPRLPQGKWQSVGRLDINTEGLLLFTNSGEMAHQLMHPRFGVEREYAVRVLGTLDEDARETLLEGVDIDGQRAAFKSIADGGGEGANHWYRVVISEGRNREVRKLFDSVDLTVSRLIRIRYGCVVLPRGLKRGVFVDLNEAEVRELRRQAGGVRDAQQGGGAPRQAQDGGGGGAGGKSRRNRRGGQGGRDRNDRAEPRVDRGDRGDRNERFERREPGEGGPIPNPLQQTFDKRAIREARQPRREYSEDGPIPNPLEQTYDKRHVQKQRGFGGGGGGGRRQGGGDGGGGQPDPMKTSLGYIGADAFVRKFQGGGGGGGGGGGRGGKRRGGR